EGVAGVGGVRHGTADLAQVRVTDKGVPTEPFDRAAPHLDVRFREYAPHPPAALYEVSGHEPTVPEVQGPPIAPSHCRPFLAVQLAAAGAAPPDRLVDEDDRRAVAAPGVDELAQLSKFGNTRYLSL